MRIKKILTEKYSVVYIIAKNITFWGQMLEFESLLH